MNSLSLYDSLLRPPLEGLPKSVWAVFLVGHRVHRMWCFYRKGKVYGNQENFRALAAGHALYCTAGQLPMVRLAAQSVLIATRAMHCKEQQGHFSESFVEWREAIEGTYPVPYKRSSEKLMYRAERIAVCSKKFFSDGFLLSMRLMDLIEAHSFSAETKSDAIKELFTNCMQHIEALSKNRSTLVSELHKHRVLIEKLLPSNISFDDFITKVN